MYFCTSKAGGPLQAQITPTSILVSSSERMGCGFRALWCDQRTFDRPLKLLPLNWDTFDHDIAHHLHNRFFFIIKIRSKLLQTLKLKTHLPLWLFFLISSRIIFNITIILDQIPDSSLLSIDFRISYYQVNVVSFSHLTSCCCSPVTTPHSADTH